MKLTNAGTMDRETLPWLSALNRPLQPRSSPATRPANPARIRQPVIRPDSRAARRDAMRRDATGCDATRRRRRESGDVKHVAVRMKKAARYVRILL